MLSCGWHELRIVGSNVVVSVSHHDAIRRSETTHVESRIGARRAVATRESRAGNVQTLLRAATELGPPFIGYKAVSLLSPRCIAQVHLQFLFAMANFGTLSSTQPHNPNKSFEVNSPPTDGISSLAFSPKANYLVATSWDNQVRCWEIQSNGSSVPKAAISHELPVLCSAWKEDGSTVFSGGCDKQAKMWPILSGGQAVTVGMHDAPIKSISWISEMNLLVTGSWDKTLKYWDLRAQTPAHTQQLPERCYAMSVRHPLMVVATADRNIVVYNLASPQTEFKRIQSPLKYQTRCVATFPGKEGFLVGSIEGRVAVQHIDDAQQSKNFTFKCHRDNNDIYAVNSIDFHPVHGTFATSGSDGAFNFWDKDSKQRLKAMQRCNQPIPCSTFNHDGTIFAYGVSYDWSKGAENHNPSQARNYILLHPTQDSEVKAKARVATSGRK